MRILFLIKDLKTRIRKPFAFTLFPCICTFSKITHTKYLAKMSGFPQSNIQGSL